jgi:hypothetical protein
MGSASRGEPAIGGWMRVRARFRIDTEDRAGKWPNHNRPGGAGPPFGQGYSRSDTVAERSRVTVQGSDR